MPAHSQGDDPSIDAPSVHVVTVSDRCVAGVREDRSGDLAEKLLRDEGFHVTRALISDGVEVVAEAVRDAAASGVDVVLTTGGTGPTPRDLTPEGTRGVLDRELPGIAEGLRRMGESSTPYAVLSRGLAGIISPAEGRGPCIVVNLPGSTGGVRDGVAYLAPLLRHLIDQAAGGDHPNPETQASPSAETRHTSCGHTVVPTPTVTLEHSEARPDPSDSARPHGWITYAPLAADDVARLVEDPAYGAVATFVGRVRDHDPDADGRVIGLTYSAHPDAGDVLRSVLAEVAAQHPQVRVAAAHRVGDLDVGDAALVVAVASVHRRPGFEAIPEVVSAIKAGVPIWKKQHTATGTSSWVGIACDH